MVQMERQDGATGVELVTRISHAYIVNKEQGEASRLLSCY